MTVSFYTLGCKLNQCETEAIASTFTSGNFSIVPLNKKIRHSQQTLISHEDKRSSESYKSRTNVLTLDVPDIVIINTCTVTSKSEQKARKTIRKVIKGFPEAVIIVTGCYAEVDPTSIRKLGDAIIVVGQHKKEGLLRLPNFLASVEPKHIKASIVDYFSSLEDEPTSNRFSFQCDNYSFHTRPFIKIQDGCNNGCAYCRIPQARGASTSIDPIRAVERLRRLENAGYKEVVLTGVNISDYSWEKTRLNDLLQRMIERTTSVRFRLSSLEPDMITEELVAVMCHPRVCPHFHIPIQSGSTKVLQLMNRNYSADTIDRAVSLLRSAKDDPFIGADILVGFPGEEAEDFEYTREAIEKNGFSSLHVFQYSPRPGTSAFRRSGKVPERVVKSRTDQLRALSLRLSDEYLRRWMGRETTVVLENRKETNNDRTFLGLTENYIRVRISDIPAPLRKSGNLVRVMLHGPTDTSGEMHGSYMG
jgi:threonylcarbamoyladenosine tRNA methylthiotransferase MtaB